MDTPLFIPNFLQTEDDVRAMVFGMRKLRSIFATEPLASRVVREMLPGPGVSTDAQLVDYLRSAAACAGSAPNQPSASGGAPVGVGHARSST